MSRAVHIVRIAARTPVGFSAAATAAAVRANICRLRLHPFMVDGAGEALRCGRDAEISAHVLGLARVTALARCALEELFAVSVGRARVPVWLALPEPRPGFEGRDTAALLSSLRALQIQDGLELQVHHVNNGHAGALYALHEAAAAIRGGACELCAVGGVDSYLHADTLDWLDAQLLLARDGVCGGFPPGEAAAFLLLASDSALRALRLNSLAQVLATAHAHETRSRDDDAGFLGEALAHAILGASAPLQLPEQRVDDIYCDINGERLRTDDWAFAVLRAQHVFRDATRYVSTISQLGDVGAAAGALSAVVAVESARRNYARGSRALLWGASWSGLRAAACLLTHGRA